MDENLVKSTMSWSERRGLRVAATLLLALATFLGGFYLSGNMVATEPPQYTYMLLLYHPPAFEERPEHVKEYGDWMRSLIESNTIATGEPLEPGGWILQEGPVSAEGPASGPHGPLAGFFMINSGSKEEAMRIASSCPHLKHKGVIELRPVMKTR